MIYLSEFDPYCAQWLRNLIAAGHLPKDSHVDDRSICDVTPGDLHGYSRCHFFAGIGAWELALQYAGWPDGGRPFSCRLNPQTSPVPMLDCRIVWTGSCPCQPFSIAGKGEGEEDSRHLWPEFHRLIRECRPDVVFGEQVEGPAARAWLDHVQDDLEGDRYAVGSCGLPAASVGAPHGRPRIWWVADAHPERLLAQARPGDAHGERDAQPCSSVGDAGAPGLPLRERQGVGRAGRRSQGRAAEQHGRPCLATWGPWADAEWIPCRDGKARPVEPGTSPVAHGPANRVGQLRAYGNAINPIVAAEFIKAYLG